MSQTKTYYDNVDWTLEYCATRNTEGTIGSSLNLSSTLEERTVGTVLGCMCGDILGVPFEGITLNELLADLQQNGEPLWKSFIPGQHMGLYHLPKRYGMYSDDTNSTLALATSLVEKKGLMALHAAHMYARFWKSIPCRGYPDSAQAVMVAVLNGEDITKTGRIAFPTGSFANGGIMRISPVGLAFRNATPQQLLEATKAAIISSHVHPESIDCSFVQARAIQILLKLSSPSDMTPEDFLQELCEISANKTVAAQILLVRQILITEPRPPLKKIASSLGSSFQIRAVEALGCSLWAFASNWNNPEQSLIDAVGLGGDTDTLAAITGALAGALHGTHWIPKRWFDNIENGERGRDYALQLSKALAKLDLTDILIPTDEEEAHIKAESAEYKKLASQ